MYGYSFDPETGGLILNDTIGQTSLEPRPVYAPEMDLLGFDAHWKYERQTDMPILWAEAENYTYRGKRIARTKGGNLNERPILEPLVSKETGEQILSDGETLLPVDLPAMNAKNEALLTALKQAMEIRIHDVYRRHKNRLDGFHVAFSGGKDSIVLLDLVAEALPPSAFVVVFGDTGMEFPDTYALVDRVEADCRARGIAFYRAKSHLAPEQSWRLFGPPSQVLRWCCSVHKSAPQTIRLREIYGKGDFVGLDFVGVRREESLARANYEVENFGKKQKGQYSQNSIFEWTSAEVWAYLLWRGLPVNEAYKKGNSRAGCLFCPLGSGGKADWFRRASYPEEVEKFLAIIRETIDDPAIESFIANGGWVKRSSGRLLKNSSRRYSETKNADNVLITVTNPRSNWREWIKTLGEIPDGFSITPTDNGYVVKMAQSLVQSVFSKRFRQVFYKAAYCIGCRVCESNCRKGAIHFSPDGKVQITDCVHCGACHEIHYGCVVADSLKQPLEERRMKGKGSINTFDDHAPKIDWVRDFFTDQNNFVSNNTLGPNQRTKFGRFLSDAGLVAQGKFSNFATIITRIGWDSSIAWGLLVAKLVSDNPQFRWYADNLKIGQSYSGEAVEQMLQADGLTVKAASSVRKSFKRLVELPLGTRLNWGFYYEEGRGNATMGRRACRLLPEDRLAILYALYLFSERSDNLMQFTLTRLLDETIVSGGVSPAILFGLGREEMARFLSGLGEAHPDFLSVTFTHDLEKISLREGKTSADVLALIASR